MKNLPGLRQFLRSGIMNFWKLFDNLNLSSTALYIFITIALIFLLTQINVIAGDSPPTIFLPVSILKWSTLRLDPLIGQVPVLFDPTRNLHYLIQVEGHYYSKYSPIPSLLSLPLYSVFMIIGNNERYELYPFLSRIMSVVISSSVSTILYLILRSLVQQRVAVLLTFLYAFGTFTWASATTTLSTQSTGELFLVLTLFTIFRYHVKPNNETSRWKTFVLIGLTTSLMVATRPQSFFVALLLIAYVIHVASSKMRALATITLGGLPTLLLLGSYNTHSFGAPYKTGYGVEALQGWTTPIWIGLPGILFSPSHGLLMYSPILLIALAFAWKVWRPQGSTCATTGSRKPEKIILARYIIIACFVQLLLMSHWWAWYGGVAYNQRMLQEIHPLLILLLAYVWKKFWRYRAFLVLFVGASFWSIWMNIARVTFYENHLSWVGVYRPDLLWSIQKSELAMYLNWYDFSSFWKGIISTLLPLIMVIILTTGVLQRFVSVSSRRKSSGL